MAIYRADGTEYKKVVTKDENTTAHMTAKGGYTGLENATGGYFRTPIAGLIPNVSGGSGYIGTSGWPFSAGYFNELYVSGVRQNFQYSTTEQWTGKYYLDGKKIYTICFIINNAKVGAETDLMHNIKNVDNIWVLDKSFSFQPATPSQNFPLNFTNADSSGYQYSKGKANRTKLTYYLGAYMYTANPVNVTFVLEYTCTDR